MPTLSHASRQNLTKNLCNVNKCVKLISRFKLEYRYWLSANIGPKISVIVILYRSKFPYRCITNFKGAEIKCFLTAISDDGVTRGSVAVKVDPSHFYHSMSLCALIIPKRVGEPLTPSILKNYSKHFFAFPNMK